jgi:glycosyltransferase involved in cell wall biosynthesis
MGANTIKIFVDAHVFDGGYQGTRTFIRELYAELCRHSDLEIFLAAADTHNLQQHFPQAANITLLRYRSRNPVTRLLLEIPALIRCYGIHYAHFQYIAPPLKNCRFIITTHDVLFQEYPREFPLPYRLIRKWLYRLSAARADLLTTVSPYSRRSIERFLGIESGAIHIIPNGVHPQYFQPHDKEAARAYVADRYGIQNFILLTGRIEPRKNHAALLRAFAELKLHTKGYSLVFVGHKSLPVPELDHLLYRLPPEVKDQLYFFSALPQDDLLQFYRAATLFVYPSKGEGFGIPPLEAAATGTPVICSNTTAMSAYSFFGESHLDPLDYGALKHHLAKILSEAPPPEQGRTIARHIQQTYCWRQSAQQLYELIRRHQTLQSSES